MATVQVTNLRKVFPGPCVALDGVSFEVQDNEFTSIVGPSGCGKTTLLNIVSDIEAPTSGEVALREGDREASVGYVFQEPRLLPWRTIRQNLLYVQDSTGDGAENHADHYLGLVG